MSLTALAQKYDLPEKTLRDAVRERAWVETRQVDRVLTAMGVPWLLEEWYPLHEMRGYDEFVSEAA